MKFIKKRVYFQFAVDYKKSEQKSGFTAATKRHVLKCAVMRSRDSAVMWKGYSGMQIEHLMLGSNITSTFHVREFRYSSWDVLYVVVEGNDCRAQVKHFLGVISGHSLFFIYFTSFNVLTVAQVTQTSKDRLINEGSGRHRTWLNCRQFPHIYPDSLKKPRTSQSDLNQVSIEYCYSLGRSVWLVAYDLGTKQNHSHSDPRKVDCINSQ
jgi:hypothetical protein